MKNIHNLLRWGGLILVLVMAGCTGNDAPVNSGKFVDSPVSGLNYRTRTISGITDRDGTFLFKNSEEVTFSVGELVLGTALGGTIVTPSNLVSGGNPDNPIVNNICVLLQTLDEDGDLNNGIKINAKTAAIVAATAEGLNFNQTATAFAADPKIVAMLAALNLNNAAGFTSAEAEGRVLQNADVAKAHLQASISPRKIVSTAFGQVSGFSPTENNWIWRGIPYAKPPVGSLRWKAPQDPDSWSGVREATSNGKVCVQQNDLAENWWRPITSFIGTEDCLYLDVYRPKTDDADLPVFLYLHGGGNTLGASQPNTAGALAKRGNIIVVVINYRLAASGFLTHPALRQGADVYDASGNYGLLDQIKALKWVKNNIAAFGGDPNMITVGGESAGAQDTLNLVLSPLAAGLFQRAFLSSPPLDGMLNLASVAEADALANTTIDGLLIRDGLATDAASAAAYRAGMTNTEIKNYLLGKTAVQLQKAHRDGTGADGSGSVQMYSVIKDGNVMPNNGSWTDVIASGNYNHVPIMIGNNNWEYKVFITTPAASIPMKSFFSVPSGPYYWHDAYRTLTGELTLDAILPTQTDKGLFEAPPRFITDYWLMNTYNVARALKTESANNKVYFYIFQWNGGGDPALAGYKFLYDSSHTADIPFWLGEYRNNPDLDMFASAFTTANHAGRVALQQGMMDYLSSFVRTGDPNPPGSQLPVWPQWSNTPGVEKIITLDANLNDHLIARSTREVTGYDLYMDMVTAYATYPAYSAFLQYWFGGLPQSQHSEKQYRKIKSVHK